jgi:dTDP-4-dehydrorhamnose reductase
LATIMPADIESIGDDVLVDACVVDAGFLSQLQTQALEPAELTVLLAARRRFYRRCAASAGRVMLLSDGRVFDAENVTGNEYDETQVVSPGSEPGKQLQALEQVLFDTTDTALVLRTGPLIAGEGEGFIQRYLQHFQAGQPLQLDNEIPCCPTPLVDFVRVVSGMIDQLSCGANCHGVYHYNSSGRSTAYEFAEVVYAFASQLLSLPEGEVQALVSGEGSQSWSPLVPMLDCERLLSDFGIKQLPWRAYLPKIIKALCEEPDK